MGAQCSVAETLSAIFSKTKAMALFPAVNMAVTERIYLPSF